MTDIDPITGLPKLPDSLYWRVGWYDYLHSRHCDGYPRSSLAIPRINICVFETRRKSFLGYAYTREVCVSHYPVLKLGNNYPTPGKGPYYAGIDGKFVESVADLTVAQIERGAEYIVAQDDYNRERRRLQEQRSDLLGNYPPKKLPEETP